MSLVRMRNGHPMEVHLAPPRGLCAGVVRAIEIVQRALEKSGRPAYARHAIGHNEHVVDSLGPKGALLVQDPCGVAPL